MSFDDFNWFSDESIVVKPKSGIAVYENDEGDAVIRTQSIGGILGLGDSFVIIKKEELNDEDDLVAVIDALIAIKVGL